MNTTKQAIDEAFSNYEREVIKEVITEWTLKGPDGAASYFKEHGMKEHHDCTVLMYNIKPSLDDKHSIDPEFPDY